MRPAVFLDRDDTLIHNDADLGDPDRVRLKAGAPQALKSLREAGYELVVVTNQGGVARGRFTEADVDQVNQRIAALVDEHAKAEGLIERFYFCPYHPEGTVEEYRRDHPWRKPNPGMIIQAGRDMRLDLARSWVIGDQERDIQAGHAAGCRTILVTRDAELAMRAQPTEVAATFSDAVRYIVTHPARPEGEQKQSTPQNPADRAKHPRPADPDSSTLARAIHDLADELRSDRQRRMEFSYAKMAAGLCQLLALLLAALGLFELHNLEVFARWMIGAALVQLLTITLLILDLKG